MTLVGIALALSDISMVVRFIVPWLRVWRMKWHNVSHICSASGSGKSPYFSSRYKMVICTKINWLKPNKSHNSRQPLEER